jgi:predicted O-methyltransferase YrrM
MICNQMGVVKERVEAVLEGLTCYGDFRAGRLSRAGFRAQLLAHEQYLLAHGLTEDQIHFAFRYPRDEEALVDRILIELLDRGALQRVDYDKAAFREHLARMRRYDHDCYQTYIYPEEARLVFALADIVRPQHIVALGSYYGWWALWAAPALAKNGGRAVLVDVNPVSNAIAESNLIKLGFASFTEVVNCDAIEYLCSNGQEFDFVLLDAEGSPDDARPEYRDKAIYNPIVSALLPHLAQQSVLVCHNILLDNLMMTDPYLRSRSRSYRSQYGQFLNVVDQIFSVRLNCPTTEGIGVYIKRTRC